MSIRLPIDIVPETDPPVFRWRHLGQDHEGQLPAPVERAVERIITVAKQLCADNAMLRGQVDGLLEAKEDAQEATAVAALQAAKIPAEAPKAARRNARPA